MKTNHRLPLTALAFFTCISTYATTDSWVIKNTSNKHIHFQPALYPTFLGITYIWDGMPPHDANPSYVIAPQFSHKLSATDKTQSTNALISGANIQVSFKNTHNQCISLSGHIYSDTASSHRLEFNTEGDAVNIVFDGKKHVWDGMGVTQPNPDGSC